MNEELDIGDMEEAGSISIDIKQNLSKINHHGKRANAIVKVMLEHSRKSAGEKVAIDLIILQMSIYVYSITAFEQKTKASKLIFQQNLTPIFRKWKSFRRISEGCC